MAEFVEIRKRSNIDLDELKNMADRLELSSPKIYHILTNPTSVEPDFYERATTALLRHLRENEPLIERDPIGRNVAHAMWDLAMLLDPRYVLDHADLIWRAPKEQ